MSADLRITQTSTGGSSARRDIAATRSELDRFGKSAAGAGDHAGRSSGKLSRFGSSVGLAARAFGPLAVAAGGAAILKFGADAISAASDTEQAMGAVDSVFGRNAKKVRAWATGAATSVGLAKSEYGNLAVVLGSMLKNNGIDDFAGKTKGLIGLGSDLAAQFGGTTKEAVEAIGSLMRGETDPIERYGVSIKQSGVNAVLAARGQSKLTGAARTQAEAQARLSLLTKQTASAQGAFRRESNTLAGSQQRLGAKFTNLKSTLGAKLIPTVTRLVSWLSNTISGTNRTAAVMRRIGAIIKSIVTPVINSAKRAFADISRAISDSKKKGDGFGTAVRAVGKIVQRVAPIIGKIMGTQVRLLGKIISGTIRGINTFVNVIRTIVTWCNNAKDAVGGLISALGNIKVPHISLPHIPGLGRSAPGLVRAAGGGSTAAPVSFSPMLSVSPSIRVTIGRREIRQVVLEVVQGELREQSRRDDGGGDRE